MKQKLKKIYPYLFGGLLFLILLNYKKIRLFFEKRKAQIETITNNTKKVEIQGTNVVVDLDTIASAIYYAFYQPDGGNRWNEDEKAAVENIIKCPKEYISKLGAVYATKYGKILKEDLISRLRTSQWKQIEYLFN